MEYGKSPADRAQRWWSGDVATRTACNSPILVICSGTSAVISCGKHNSRRPQAHRRRSRQRWPNIENTVFYGLLPAAVLQAWPQRLCMPPFFQRRAESEMNSHHPSTTFNYIHEISSQGRLLSGTPGRLNAVVPLCVYIHNRPINCQPKFDILPRANLSVIVCFAEDRGQSYPDICQAFLALNVGIDYHPFALPAPALSCSPPAADVNQHLFSIRQRTSSASGGRERLMRRR